MICLIPRVCLDNEVQPMVKREGVLSRGARLLGDPTRTEESSDIKKPRSSLEGVLVTREGG